MRLARDKSCWRFVRCGRGVSWGEGGSFIIIVVFRIGGVFVARVFWGYVVEGLFSDRDLNPALAPLLSPFRTPDSWVYL